MRENNPFEEIQIFSLSRHRDDRGYLIEQFRASRYADVGLSFPQDNLSYSVKNVVRGMHFQEGQAKLVGVIKGVIWDVFVDIRPSSKTFGTWGALLIDASNPRLVLIPDGFAHGFCVISDEAYVSYKMSKEYNPQKERSFYPYDPCVAIAWPLGSDKAILSDKDAKALNLSVSRC